jgi:TolB-like protein
MSKEKKYFRINFLFLMWVHVLLAAFWGCAGEPSGPAYIKNGKEYGKVRGAFRHRWWNYYERGLSFADGEFYNEALKDFNTAIEMREKDQRRARTYGMHFVDYFPHRELGIVNYKMGKLDDAKKELELSIMQFPSAKARFYLDRVRKDLILQEGRLISPPILTLDMKDHELWTREDPVHISGVAIDEQFVSGINISGTPLFIEGSQKQIPFNKSLHLSQGQHTIEVEAKNLFGKVARRKIVIHIDRQGPLITVENLTIDRLTSGLKVEIQGSIHDEAGVDQVILNKKVLPIKKGREVYFSETFSIDTNTLNLSAVDRLGNETSADIDLSRAVAGNKPLLLASADSDLKSLVAGLFGPKDTRPPRISMKGFTDTQTVYLDKIYIDGQVSDENKITHLAVDGLPILRRKGRSIFFGYLADLNVGKNIINVEALDEAGNRAAKKIFIFRKIPTALKLEERLSITVMPFDHLMNVSDTSLAFQANLVDHLVNRNRFNVVEREKLDRILQEQKISRTKLIDRQTALRVGRLTAAQSIIAGVMIVTTNGIEIVSRLIDTETSQILASNDVYDEVQDLRALNSMAEALAIKFQKDFPLLDGLILQRKGANIFTDLGQDKVRIYRRLIVFHEEPVTHPNTGKVLGADNIIVGRARVTQVMPEMSKAKVIRGKPETIRQFYKVITE